MPTSEQRDPDKRSTPFDHPLFLPILLLGLGLWFAYDGWISDHIQSVMFNRVSAVVLLGAGAYSSVRTWRRPRGGEGAAQRSPRRD